MTLKHLALIGLLASFALALNGCGETEEPAEPIQPEEPMQSEEPMEPQSEEPMEPQSEEPMAPPETPEEETEGTTQY